jgi:predicted amidophosphoribosyltransferase
MRLKFGGYRGTAEAFAPYMVEALQRAPPVQLPAREPGPEPVGPEITWVPLGRGRRRTRGFDQAEALARAVGDRLELAARPLLERTLETTPQARRGGEARRMALAGAFRSLGPIPVRLVLVDDVLTSGATAAECARTLLRRGAREVAVLTVARSLGGPLPARCYDPAGLRPGSVVARETFSR